MNATTLALLSAAIPLLSSAITGVLVHLAHSRHMDLHADNAQLAPDVLRGVTDLLVAATHGKFVDHGPLIVGDVEKVVADLRTPTAAAPAQK